VAGVGYADPVVLMGPTVAWPTLLRLARPDLVFADHAPGMARPRMKTTMSRPEPHFVMP
jgi:hypothetical protein